MASSNVYRQAETHDASTSLHTTEVLDTRNRRVLGDVSPNVRKTSPAAAMLTRKPLMGSPLKRSFNATLESGEGLTYLKKRKLSGDELLSEVGSNENKRSQGWEHGLDGTATTFRAFLQPDDDDDNDDDDDAVRLHYMIPTCSEHVLIYPHLQTQSNVMPERDASPTEPNTPSEDDNAEHSSVERKSFSSLINYDPSSQQSSNVLLHGLTRAEMLKLRLRIAMYKVRTNQTNIPFAKLRLKTKDSTATISEKMMSEAVEEAVAVLRRGAQQQQKASATQRQEKTGSAAFPSSIPKLLPGPTLRPTAFSSRMIYDQPSSITSSPRSGTSPDRLPVAPSPLRMLSTPQRGAGARMIYGTPGTAERFHEPSEQELTSSVVKGRVAEGLLGLRNAV